MIHNLSFVVARPVFLGAVLVKPVHQHGDAIRILDNAWLPTMKNSNHS